MAAYDSDSSAGDDLETGVTLGYASKEPTGDDFSQLGGHPTWLDGLRLPPGDLAKCKVCNSLTSLLLQLNGDLPEQHPGHERRLYLFACRRKACRRKDGSIRGLRFTRVNGDAAPQTASPKTSAASKHETIVASNSSVSNQMTSGLGNALFGTQSTTNPTGKMNPFGPPSATTGSSTGNPFATAANLAAKPPQKPSATISLSPEGVPTPKAAADNLAQTFAQKASIGVNNEPTQPISKQVEAWPDISAFPEPYPSYYVDADKEYLDPPEPESAASQQIKVSDLDVDGEANNNSSSSAGDDKSAFESTMDKTFQHFADRVAQNPEQILRYDFGGQALLYSKLDKVGKTWPRMPRCAKCGGERCFELQLTPHAIDELEAEDVSLEGIDWGTVILAACKQDCVGWNEEWIGVQWEEIAAVKKSS